MQFYHFAHKEMPPKASLDQGKPLNQLMKFQQQFLSYTIAAQQAAAQHFHQVMQHMSPQKSQMISSKSGSSEK